MRSNFRDWLRGETAMPGDCDDPGGAPPAPPTAVFFPFAGFFVTGFRRSRILYT
jgi:hypothetical protein